MKKLLLSIALLLAIAQNAFATTYYVRTASLGSDQDGGTTTQCTGLANAPYDGSGTGEACAWGHYYYAVGWTNGATAAISGGDTLIITGDSEHGYLGDGLTFSGCSNGFPWDCFPRPVPSGADSSNKTKIYGHNWENCNGIGDTDAMYGVERAANVLNLEGTDNVDVRCIQISDKEACGEFHANASLACERDTYPYGDWSPNGISIVDSTNAELHHVYVHGLANRGVFSGRIQDLEWTHGSIDGNAYVGWEGDRGDPDDWANGGTLVFEGNASQKFSVQWNGCVEAFPPAATPVNSSCHTQGQNAGYGDGFAPSDATGGLGGANWILRHVDFSRNTSDGLDLLYKGDGDLVTIVKSNFTHNTGNQVKITGDATIDDTIMSSDCDFFSGKAYTYTGSGGFTHCRASGNTVSWNVAAPGEQLLIRGSTIAGKGDILIMSSGGDGICNGTEVLQVRNTILQGDEQYGGGDQTDDYYAAGATGNGDGSCGSLAISYSAASAGNIIFDTKAPVPSGTGITNDDPEFTSLYNDFSISVTSPARGLLNTGIGNAEDFNDFTRVDTTGALEYGSEPSGGSNPPPNPEGFLPIDIIFQDIKLSS